MDAAFLDKLLEQNPQLDRDALIMRIAEVRSLQQWLGQMFIIPGKQPLGKPVGAAQGRLDSASVVNNRFGMRIQR